ncbi:MAG: hypothetical protein AAB425_03255 [Bdellovibrionota bacterium]
MKLEQRVWAGLFAVAILNTAACGSGERDVEYYGDLSLTPGGIAITDPAEHRGGYGKRQCLLCHNPEYGLHRSRTSVLDADALNAVLRASSDPEGICLTCHGPNGLSAGGATP